MPLPEPSRSSAALALGLILLLTGALYAPTLRGGFTYDDAYVAKAVSPAGRPNPMVSELRPLAEYFRSHYWRGEYQAHAEYRPVTILSYAVVHRALGARLGPREALAQHAVNVLLHLLATGLVYALLRRVRAGRAASLIGTLAFGIHAVHSEAVASVVGRAELLAFAAGAGATLLLSARVTAARAGVGVLLFFVAFASKESALAWAPFLGLVRFARAPHGSALETLKRAAGPALAVAVVPVGLFLLLRSQVIGALGPIPLPSPLANPLAHVDAGERVLSAVMIQGVALGKLLWPFHLAADYGQAVFDLVQTPLDPRFLSALLLLLAFGLGALALARRAPLLLLAAAAFFGFGFVTSNLVVVIGTIFGERLLYAPSLAVSFALAWSADVRRAPGWLIVAAVLLWGVACSLTILERNAAWRSNESLYLTDAAAQPRSIKLNVLAADVYAGRGDVARQFEHLERAIGLGSEPPRDWLRLGLGWAAHERWDDAGEAALRGLAASRDSGTVDRFALLALRARALEASGDEAGAAREDQRALRAYRALREDRSRAGALLAHPLDGPGSAIPWLALAENLARRGAESEVERALRLGLGAIRAAPGSERFRLHWALAEWLSRRGRGRRPQLSDQLAAALSADGHAFEARLAELPPEDPRVVATRRLRDDPARP